MSSEIVTLASDYLDGTVSEYIGLFLKLAWQPLTTQYVEYASAVRIRQAGRETLSEVASRVLTLAKITFKDAGERC